MIYVTEMFESGVAENDLVQKEALSVELTRKAYIGKVRSILSYSALVNIFARLVVRTIPISSRIVSYKIDRLLIPQMGILDSA